MPFTYGYSVRRQRHNGFLKLKRVVAPSTLAVHLGGVIHHGRSNGGVEAPAVHQHFVRPVFQLCFNKAQIVRPLPNTHLKCRDVYRILLMVDCRCAPVAPIIYFFQRLSTGLSSPQFAQMEHSQPCASGANSHPPQSGLPQRPRSFVRSNSIGQNAKRDVSVSPIADSGISAAGRSPPVPSRIRRASGLRFTMRRLPSSMVGCPCRT